MGGVIRAVFFGDVPHRLAGAQKSLLLSLSGLAQHGVEPIIAFPHPGRFEEACRKAGLRAQILESPPSFQSFGKALMRMSPVEQLKVMAREGLPFSRRLLAFAEQQGAGVMHFNTPRGLTMAGGAAALSKLPVVMHLRGVPAISRHIWLAAQSMADRFVLVAHALQKDFAPSVRPRTVVVYNGVVPKPVLERSIAQTNLRAKLASMGISVSESAQIVVSVSSPTPFKGLHHLLEAARKVLSRGRDAVFLCAGAGSGEPYEAWLRQRIDAAGLSQRFVLLGFWDEVHELLSAADITALPSVQKESLDIGTETLRVHGTEGLPRAILESFAASVPVVATEVAGVREQVEDGRTGYIVAPGDPAQLAEALEKALADSMWLLRAGAAGREVVTSRFTVDSAARGLAEELKSLALSPPTRRARLANALALARDVASNKA